MTLICRGKTYEIEVLLSAMDYEWAAERGNWFITHAVSGVGKQYAVRSEKGVLVFLHKVVLERSGIIPPSPTHTIGDHWNGNSLDNRRGNLRWATHQMNARNLFGFAAQQMELFA